MMCPICGHVTKQNVCPECGCYTCMGFCHSDKDDEDEPPRTGLELSSPVRIDRDAPAPLPPA